MSEVRVDRSRLPRMARTDEGYLRGEAVATRIGVFEYINGDGSIRAELRHPDEVLAADSLASLRMIPITINHPGKLVDAKNAKELGVGLTGENVRVDGRHIVVPLTITTEDGIKAVENGQRELSLGYRLDLIEEVGVYEGVAYTHRQTNIVYNHLALVNQARAGRAARLNLDGAAVQLVETDRTEADMHKVNIDGIQYDAAPEVARALTKLEADLSNAVSGRETAEARADEAEAKRDAAEKKAADAEAKVNADEIDKLVRSKLELVTAARKLVNEDVDLLGLSDRDIMVTAIAAAHKDVKLDGKSDDYVRARFDAVVEAAPKKSPVDPLRRDTQAVRDDAAAEDEAYRKSVENINSRRNQSAA